MPARLQKEYEVVHVTQNADRLLEKAGCVNVLHLHGTWIGRSASDTRASS